MYKKGLQLARLSTEDVMHYPGAKFDPRAHSRISLCALSEVLTELSVGREKQRTHPLSRERERLNLSSQEEEKMEMKS